MAICHRLADVAASIIYGTLLPASLDEVASGHGRKPAPKPRQS